MVGVQAKIVERQPLSIFIPLKGPPPPPRDYIEEYMESGV